MACGVKKERSWWGAEAAPALGVEGGRGKVPPLAEMTWVGQHLCVVRVCAVRVALSRFRCTLTLTNEKERKASKAPRVGSAEGRVGLWALCCWTQTIGSYGWTLISFIPIPSRRASLFIMKTAGSRLVLFRRECAARFLTWLQSMSEPLAPGERSPCEDGGSPVRKAGCCVKPALSSLLPGMLCLLLLQGVFLLFFLTVKDNAELITITSLLPLKFHYDFKWVIALAWVWLFRNSWFKAALLKRLMFPCSAMRLQRKPSPLTDLHSPRREQRLGERRGGSSASEHAPRVLLPRSGSR